MKPLLLAPRPRRITRRKGYLRMRRGDAPIHFAASLNLTPPTRVALRGLFVDAPRGNPTAFSIRIDPARFARCQSAGQARRRKGIPAAPDMAAQAYRLRVSRDGIHIIAGGPAGVWYAVQTLRQLTRGGNTIPLVDIHDWPDIAARGVMLDISRDKVPTMRTLRRLIDMLASWKINQLQLYTEHTFAYRRHRTVWRDASPITPAEARRLDAYCRARFIELVPNQNCFGHMERWLRHKRYRPLAETTGPWKDPWGRTRTYPMTLCPGDPRSIRLVEELLGELLPHFSSRMVNVGCDETFELGQGRSAAAAKKRGVGRVYLDFLLKIHRRVAGHDRRMQFWADIVHQHPELIRELPRDAIALEWGYEADHPFDRRCRALANAGLDFYVCPGTSTWCSFAGRTDNAIANLRSAAEAGVKHGAAGYLITDWGDGGHRQYLPASYIPFLYGACASWGVKANRRMDAARAASVLAFDDASGKTGDLWYELGLLHRLIGIPSRNQSWFFRVMQADFADHCRECMPDSSHVRRDVDRLRLAVLEGLLAARNLERQMLHIRCETHDQRLAAVEFAQTISIVCHALMRGSTAMMLADQGSGVEQSGILAKHLEPLVERHATLWKLRNRPGGFRDSLAHYQRNLDEYRKMAKCAETAAGCGHPLG